MSGVGSNSEARKRLAGKVAAAGSAAFAQVGPATGFQASVVEPRLTEAEVAALRFGAGVVLTEWPEPAQGEQPCVEREVAAGLVRALDELAAAQAEAAELLARLRRREADHAERLAEEATEGDTGVCRTCALPITYSTVEEPGYLPRTGWSDGARSDALVCFKAVRYRHVPLVGRERGIWDAATKAAAVELEEVRAEVSRWEAHFGTAQEQRDDALARAEAAESALAAAESALAAVQSDETEQRVAEAIRRADGYMTEGEARSCARHAIRAVLPAPTSPERSDG